VSALADDHAIAALEQVERIYVLDPIVSVVAKRYRPPCLIKLPTGDRREEKESEQGLFRGGECSEAMFLAPPLEYGPVFV
jgi:hypothetical protein